MLKPARTDRGLSESPDAQRFGYGARLGPGCPEFSLGSGAEFWRCLVYRPFFRRSAPMGGLCGGRSCFYAAGVGSSRHAICPFLAIPPRSEDRHALSVFHHSWPRSPLHWSQSGRRNDGPRFDCDDGHDGPDRMDDDNGHLLRCAMGRVDAQSGGPRAAYTRSCAYRRCSAGKLSASGKPRPRYGYRPKAKSRRQLTSPECRSDPSSHGGRSRHDLESGMMQKSAAGRRSDCSADDGTDAGGQRHCQRAPECDANSCPQHIGAAGFRANGAQHRQEQERGNGHDCDKPCGR